MGNVMRLMKPENLDINEIVRLNPVDIRKPELKKEYLLFICHSLICSRASNRKRMMDEGTEFAPLCSTFLDAVVHDYPRYLQYLICSKVIESDNRFIKGEKCRGYRFTSKYSGVNIVTRQIKSYLLKRAIRKLRELKAAAAKKDTWGYGYLTKWWDTGKLAIDEEKANQWIIEHAREKIDKLEPGYTQEQRHNIIDIALDFRNHVRSINDQSYGYGFSGEGHRFYNPITNLKKELRQYLTYDGKNLVNIDIKNSQPFLTILLHDVNFWKGKAEKYKIGEIIKEIGIDKEVCEYNVTLLESSEISTVEDFGLKNYIDLVVSGRFYEFIGKEFYLPFGKRFDSRDKVKKEVLRILYSDPAEYGNPFYNPCYLFGHYFPITFELLCNIKSKNYKLLPILLQRIESYLLIDVICKKISQIDPEIPLFTIHDSIITTEENQGIVEAIMRQEIKNFVGFDPKVSVEYLNASSRKEISVPIG